MSLQLRSIAVPQWIMEKILIRYKGNVKVHPSVFLALSTVRDEIMKSRSSSIFMSWVPAMVLLLHPLFYGIQHFEGELKGLPLPTHTS